MSKKTSGDVPKEEPYTKIPNRVIRSKRLTPNDLRVFCCIASCNPSFPTYITLMEWSGLSRDSIWKSLQNLERIGVITRWKDGRKVRYSTHWISLPDGLNDLEPVRFTDRTSPLGGLESVRPADSKKNNEKEQEKGGSKISHTGGEEHDRPVLSLLQGFGGMA